MKKITRVACTTSLALALGGLAGMARAAEKITIMTGGAHKIIYLPAILAERLGYFEHEGLDVSLVSEPAGVNAEDEMIAGAVQGVVGFYDHCIDLQSKGIEAESVVQFSKVPGEVVLVSRQQSASIKSPGDWKGKALGVTDLGSSTDFLIRYLAVKAGLARSDYTMVAVGAGSSFTRAMRENRIAAGMTTDPTAAKMLAAGEASLLVDLRSESGTRAALGGDYPAAALYMTNAWVNAHRSETEKLVRALVKTLKYIHHHTAAQIADKMPSDYSDGDRALYISALKSFLPMFTAHGRMPADGPETVLRVMSTIKPRVNANYINLSRTYTNAFVDAASR